jgi:dTDP-4-amino-4,6-dideoxygalactose transaminase
VAGVSTEAAAKRPARPRLRPKAEGAKKLSPIIFGAVTLGDREIAEVVDTLRSGWIGTGPKTKRFERKFANYVGAEHAVGTNSGTAALHLSLDALGVGPGDEVITTPLTFVATANVIEHCGARPVFADVRWEDGNLDPDEVEARVTSRTKAIIPVHYGGRVADVGRLRLRHPNIPIVVDAAHAVEARYEDGTSSASNGATCTAYSFYATKNLVTGEGGMLVTDDDAIAERARVQRLHGLDNDAWKRYLGGRYGEYELLYAGFKYNMTDVQASLGIHQLGRIEQRLRRRRAIWSRYNAAFVGVEGIQVPPVSLAPDVAGRHALHLYTLWLDWKGLSTTRMRLVTRLRDLGIGTGWHFRAVHLHRYYREKYGFVRGSFPIAEAIADRTLSIPISAALTGPQADRVIEAMLTVVASEA